MAWLIEMGIQSRKIHFPDPVTYLDHNSSKTILNPKPSIDSKELITNLLLYICSSRNISFLSFYSQ